ncbi:26S proteasome regulatory complex, non-ATPase subcomplex, Rpn2/Psmd1 subunit [Actinidia rufa]|uniref:26S proteasome regulatory complex, non-ATPase subcomplex, Rpn2/Psmd1 subunit n=1 Tax=Actinidia rufa TaxID=165716 RepID=A0A7J0FT54_9ERIC|nr:26S proteasome regulatory complex, non-ATPase subcomplex, Rpn2/Psmd1 subunit [Actinidia rufa]
MEDLDQIDKGKDEYACLKSKAAESRDEGAKMDPCLEAIVEKMMDKCILDGYEQAIGMAIECRRLDKLEEAINLREYGCEHLKMFKYRGSQVSNQDVEATYAERSDLLILKTIKQSTEMRNSVFHSATIYSNAIMHAGTTMDTFLWENLDWLSRATNWAKFSATAGLVVIHRGHLRQCRSLMAPYLPQTEAGGGGNSYSEGGGLYALGLIHANHSEEFILEPLTGAGYSTWRNLYIDLAALGTADESIFDDVKTVLYTDSAVAGEAAGASEMLAYAHEMQHEKITRGLALVIALAVYGREEEADTLIEQMTRILFYVIVACMHWHTVEQLLASSPCCLSLTTPHVRYGAALAVGISCAGALIAMTMVMVQINEASDSRVGAFR